MRRRPEPETPLFRFHDLEAGDQQGFTDAIAEIHRGDYAGLIWRQAVAPETRDGLVAGLDAGRVDLERVPFPMRPGAQAPPYTLGRPLMLSADPVDYHRSADRFRRDAAALWRDPAEPCRTIEGLLSRFSGHRPVSVAQVGEQRCAPATLRVLPPGCDIGAHVGNDFVFLPQAERLARTIDVRCQLSWFVPLRGAEQGGELQVYGLEFDDTAELRRDRPPGSDGMDELKGLTFLVDLADSELVRPQAGDLVLFDGGRWYHRVRPVRGRCARITLGGFLAFSRDHDAVHYWS